MRKRMYMVGLLIIFGLSVVILVIFVSNTRMGMRSNITVSVDDKVVSITSNYNTSDWVMKEVDCLSQYSDMFNFTIVCIEIIDGENNKLLIDLSSSIISPGGINTDVSQFIEVSLSEYKIYRDIAQIPSRYDYRIITSSYYSRESEKGFKASIPMNGAYLVMNLAVRDISKMWEIDRLVEGLEINVQ